MGYVAKIQFCFHICPYLIPTLILLACAAVPSLQVIPDYTPPYQKVLLPVTIPVSFSFPTRNDLFTFGLLPALHHTKPIFQTTLLNTDRLFGLLWVEARPWWLPADSEQVESSHYLNSLKFVSLMKPSWNQESVLEKDPYRRHCSPKYVRA